MNVQEAQVIDFGTLGLSAVTYSCIQDDPGDSTIPFNDGGNNNNIDDDPVFADPINDNYRLGGCSPCIDAANSGVVPCDEFDIDGDEDPVNPIPELTPDLDRLDRILDDLNTTNTGAGTPGALCQLIANVDNPHFLDMGAYEFQPGTTLFVDDDVPFGVGDGQSWGTAFYTLTEALWSAAASGGVVTQIHVAQGTYLPFGPGGCNACICSRHLSFQLVDGVTVKGGYAGVGNPSVAPCFRDTAQFVSTLSGDFCHDDNEPGGDNSENAYHVVTGSGTGASAILDGFTITGGNADGTTQEKKSGGGMYNVGGSPSVTQCEFLGNTAEEYGGGMYNMNLSSPIVTNCIFGGNTVTGPAARGGGVANINNSSPTITNCMFTGNTSSSAGSGGGISNMVSSPTLTNCTFSGNTAGFRGGGISNEIVSNPTLANCIVWGNTEGDPNGSTESAQINDWGGIEPSVSTVTYSCIQDADPNDASIPFGAANFNIDDDPLFINPDGTTPDLHLMSTSPCIDTGNNNADTDVDTPGIQPLPDKDLEGNDRIVDGDVTTNPGAVVDMGALEFDPTQPALALHGSEKLHGPAGSFLIESGNVECRDIQGKLTLIYVFDESVYSADGDAFVAGDFALTNGSFVSIAQSSDLKTLTITCNNVLDAKCFAIAFTVENAAGVEASFDHAWPILRGDADGDGMVDVDDTTEINNQNGNPIDANNYRCDIDSDGLIEGDSTSPVGDDWAIANTAQGNGLLPCWPVSDSISSRKSHGQRDYDIPSGGVEPRTGDLLIVFEFDRLVRSLDDDPLAPTDFTISSGTVAWVSAGWDWSTVEVTILGASDKETFTISFDAEDKDNFPIYTGGCWPMLVGDVDGDGSTSSVDTSAIAGANRAPITSSNFKYDIDANGQITGAAPDTTDYDLANANTGQSVTTCP